MSPIYLAFSLLFTHSLTYSLAYLFTHSLAHSLIHSLIHLLIHSLTHPPTYAFFSSFFLHLHSYNNAPNSHDFIYNFYSKLLFFIKRLRRTVNFHVFFFSVCGEPISAAEGTRLCTRTRSPSSFIYDLLPN